jgi:hypothetical protein
VTGNKLSRRTLKLRAKWNHPERVYEGQRQKCVMAEIDLRSWFENPPRLLEKKPYQSIDVYLGCILGKSETCRCRKTGAARITTANEKRSAEGQMPVSIQDLKLRLSKRDPRPRLSTARVAHNLLRLICLQPCIQLCGAGRHPSPIHLCLPTTSR